MNGTCSWDRLKLFWVVPAIKLPWRASDVLAAAAEAICRLA